MIGLTVPPDEVDSGESDLDQVSATCAFKFSKLGEVKTGDFKVSFPLSLK